MTKKPTEIPEILNKAVDVVLAYKPKPKSKAAKRRAKSAVIAVKEQKKYEQTKFKRAAD